jgi:hypothetical protein
VHCSIVGAYLPSSLEQILELNRSLLTLDLSWNPLGDGGCHLLCTALAGQAAMTRGMLALSCWVPAAVHRFGRSGRYDQTQDMPALMGDV